MDVLTGVAWLVGGFLLVAYFPSLPLYYHVRCAWLLFKFRFVSGVFDWKVGAVQESRAWFDDLDFNFHMNNAAYNKNIEYGRFELWVRTGLPQYAWKRGWHMGNGGVSFRFVKEIKPFQRYRMTTRFHSCGTKWFYMEHTFSDPMTGRLFAAGFTRFCFKTRDRKDVPPIDVLRDLGHEEFARAKAGEIMDQAAFSNESVIPYPG